MDLPGHADEVFSVDWSTSGKQVASGGRDRHIKMWALHHMLIMCNHVVL